MKAADVRQMTPDQLDDKLVELRKEQFNLRFQRSTGQLENTSRVRLVRRDIARIETIAQQKRTGAPMPTAAAQTVPAKKAEAPKTKAKKPAKGKK